MEPMNASPHHSKVRVTLSLSDPVYVAGDAITGKMEIECRADRGLALSLMAVELFAVQELTSRDHSATSPFIHTRRLFQGPGLPPSNAVLPHPLPGEPPLPQHHYQARKGITTFFFRFPVPLSSPASINFGNGLAKVRYEVRASIGVSWKGERRVVTDRVDAHVVEGLDQDLSRLEQEGVIVAENGKLWVQGRVVGGAAIAGQTACVELQVKNHTSKKTTGLSLTLVRSLHLANTPANQKASMQITDTLTSVNFRGPEYMVPAGVEGVASLVFDVPKEARGVRGGLLDGDEESEKKTESIFDIKCAISIKVGMGIGSKDIFMEIPVSIYHPLALPQNPQDPYLNFAAHPQILPAPTGPYGNAAPSSPIPYGYPMSHTPFPDPTRVWSPPPISPTPQPYQFFNVPAPTGEQAYYFPPPPVQPFARSMSIRRSTSTGPPVMPNFTGIPGMPMPMPSGLPPQLSHPLSRAPSRVPSRGPLPFPTMGAPSAALPLPVSRVLQDEQNRGARARRVSNHLRMTSRNRSVSPQTRTLANVAVEVSAPLQARARQPLPAAPVAPSTLDTNMAGVNASPGVSPVTPKVAVPIVSPRPVLSPKQSFTNERRRSADVAELERMADEVAKMVAPQAQEAPGPSEPAAPVVSPRPVRSPRQSFSNERRRSADVVELERLADEVSRLGRDVVQMEDVPSRDKTLPGPPLPTARDRVRSGVTVARPRAKELFPPSAMASPQVDQDVPPTPTLTATPVRVMKLGRSQLGLGGLDALEAKLLSEVGTRKPEKKDRPPDVRSILPISIPSPAETPVDPADDSAISSLSLADQNAVVPDKTIKSGSGSDIDVGDDAGGYTTSREFERKKSRGKEPKVGDEARRMRKEARGRVAAWLGSVEPVTPPSRGSPSMRSVDLSPLADSPAVSPRASLGAASPTPISPGLVSTGALGAVSPRATSPARVSVRAASPAVVSPRDADEQERESNSPAPATLPEVATLRAVGNTTDRTVRGQPEEQATIVAPNPRSSGFVPIGTTRASMLIQAAQEQVEENIKVATIKRIPAERRAANLAKLWETQSPSGIFSESAASPTPSKAPSSPLAPKRTFPGKAATRSPSAGKTTNPVVRKSLEPTPRPSLSPPSGPTGDSPRYDIRSARGGRGGKVASVTAIWAQNSDTDQATSRDKTTPTPLKTAKRASLPTPARSSPLGKSTSPVTPSPLNAIRESNGYSPWSSTPQARSAQNVGDLTARRAAKIKSTSVPAALSNSFATPVLSSTASLARPLTTPPPAHKPPPDFRPGMPTTTYSAPVKRAPSVLAELPPERPTSAKPEMVFGQAKLKDLIRKYQGLSSP